MENVAVSGALSDAPVRRGFAGWAVLGIAALHTVFGLLLGSRLLPDAQMQALAGDRIVLLELTPLFALSAATDGATLAMFWYLFFGFALVPLGALLWWLERRHQRVPRFVGWQLLALGLGGGLCIPDSGLWLALIPAWSILRRGAQAVTSARNDGRTQ